MLSSRGCRTCRACRRRCHEDATRKLLLWNLSYTDQYYRHVPFQAYQRVSASRERPVRAICCLSVSFLSLQPKILQFRIGKSSAPLLPISKVIVTAVFFCMAVARLAEPYSLYATIIACFACVFLSTFYFCGPKLIEISNLLDRSLPNYRIGRYAKDCASLASEN